VVLGTPAPPAPEPVRALPPAPRTLWSAERFRLEARDWTDGHPSTYSVLVRHGSQWQPATGEECISCLLCLAQWIDAQQREGRHSDKSESYD
jgi:hypothetical protein